jgi:PHP family Zn ribbon phosphoesterase
MGGMRPSGTLCSEECRISESEAKYQAMMAAIVKDSCKVCGRYLCSNHVDWAVCEGCPQKTKYSLKYHWRCPSCGKIPEGVEPGPREWSPRGLAGIR